MSPKSRRSPVPHKVNPKHPRYAVQMYDRGSRVEYGAGLISRSNREGKIYFPNQKPSDFKKGDKVGLWQINESGANYLSRDWVIHQVKPNGGILASHWFFSNGEPLTISFGGDEFAKSMVKMSEEDYQFDVFVRQMRMADSKGALNDLTLRIASSGLPHRDRQTLFEMERLHLPRVEANDKLMGRMKLDKPREKFSRLSPNVRWLNDTHSPYQKGKKIQFRDGEVGTITYVGGSDVRTITEETGEVSLWSKQSLQSLAHRVI